MKYKSPWAVSFHCSIIVLLGPLGAGLAHAESPTPDGGGYYSLEDDEAGGPTYQFEDISDVGLLLLHDGASSDEGYVIVNLPFDFPFYDAFVSQLSITTNGVMYFNNDNYLGVTTSQCIPGSSQYDPQEFIIAPYWDDLLLNPAGSGQVFLATLGDYPQRRAIIQYTGVNRYNAQGDLTFQVALFEESGDIEFRYLDVDLSSTAISQGARAIVGIQRDPEVGTAFSCWEKALRSQSSILFTTQWDRDGDGANRTIDCDDHNADIYPAFEGHGASPERCDGLDNDCDGSIDEDGATDAVFWYEDADNDGYGDDASEIAACENPGETPGAYLSHGGDCDDSNPAIHPDAPEICNEIDDNCDGTTDADAEDRIPLYDDDDGDGYGAGEISLYTCPGSIAVGYAEAVGDCDDGAPQSYPGAYESCDGADNDCDSAIDEGASELVTVYLDADGDGYGDDGESLQACYASPPYTYVGGDCDDGLDASHPGAPETCDGQDNDCDAQIDESPKDAPLFYEDADADGYPNAQESLEACTAPAGYMDIAVFEEPIPWDCNDASASIHVGATENCNGLDDDCDARIDEGLDDDGDGYTNCTDPCPDDPFNDGDGDGYCASDDNCPTQSNADQLDSDGDGYGDICDDSDLDGHFDPVDNCPDAANTDQIDSDRDGIGDACDGDVDGDEVPNHLDNCPQNANPDQKDSDADGSGDVCDDTDVEVVCDPDVEICDDPEDEGRGCAHSATASPPPSGALALILLGFIKRLRRQRD